MHHHHEQKMQTSPTVVLREGCGHVHALVLPLRPPLHEVDVAVLTPEPDLCQSQPPGRCRGVAHAPVLCFQHLLMVQRATVRITASKARRDCVGKGTRGGALGAAATTPLRGRA